MEFGDKQIEKRLKAQESTIDPESVPAFYEGVENGLTIGTHPILGRVKGIRTGNASIAVGDPMPIVLTEGLPRFITPTIEAKQTTPTRRRKTQNENPCSYISFVSEGFDFLQQYGNAPIIATNTKTFPVRFIVFDYVLQFNQPTPNRSYEFEVPGLQSKKIRLGIDVPILPNIVYYSVNVLGEDCTALLVFEPDFVIIGVNENELTLSVTPDYNLTEYEYQILDINGNLVFTDRFELNGTNSISIITGGLPPNDYFLQLAPGSLNNFSLTLSFTIY